jgi:predicted HicB family RNase H-like nuclease
MEKRPNPKQIRIDPDLYEKALVAAKKAGLTFSGYVKNLIAKDVNRS